MGDIYLENRPCTQKLQKALIMDEDENGNVGAGENLNKYL